ncbi:MAG TPA: hypothetical protein VMI11_07665 [Actinomycetes bacterium]|nr:hypothetical protein [Actinomycetes bacterium]
MSDDVVVTRSALRTPRSAAVAGIVFAVLMSASIVLVRWVIRADPAQAGIWLTEPHRRDAARLGLALLPFAGIAFLWFVGVIRDRIGVHEDRFFATVFLGSGLLFVGMLFVAAAVAGGLLELAGSEQIEPDVWTLAHNTTFNLLSIYAIRMAAVFMISCATMTLRSGVMPRWLGYSGYVAALLLLVGTDVQHWLQFLFPLWVFVLSVHILIASARAPRTP